jgi:hypothetical protein
LLDLLIAAADKYARLKSKHQYEEMLYWGHQLFCDAWDATPVNIREKEDVEES